MTALRVLRDDGAEFPSATSAALASGMSKQSVIKSCDSGIEVCGHRFSYADPDVTSERRGYNRRCELCRKWHRVLGDMGRCADGYSASARDTCPRWS